MSVDDRLRTALLEAVSDRTLDQERALQAVRSRVPALTPDVVDVEARRRPSARGPRLVAAAAVCTLIAGAIALPVLLRSSRDEAPRAVASSEQCGRELSRGYRSTASVRLERVPPAEPGGLQVRFADPVRAALALCDTVRERFRVDEVHFAAATDAGGTVLSLAVSTPKPNQAAALAKDWALTFVQARLAGAARQFREQNQHLAEHVRGLHDELRIVDTKLAEMAPEIYGDVLRFDAPSSGLLGPRGTVPPVPERGSVELLNLAYERIALIEALTQAADASSSTRIGQVAADPYASLSSRSEPIRFPAPADGSGPALAVVASAFLAGAALLGAGGFLVVGRRRRPQSP